MNKIIIDLDVVMKEKGISKKFRLQKLQFTTNPIKQLL